MKILFVLLISFNSYAYFLITNNGSHFKTDKVKVRISSNSTCTNTGFNPQDIIDLAIEGAKETWNKVPKANIKIVKGSDYNTSDGDLLTGELCVNDSSSTCAAGSAPQLRDIVIACNDNGVNFPSSTVLAISAPNNIEGNKIKGALILLNNRADTNLDLFSNQEMKRILAHEIGHALGIGHSKDTDALMFSSNITNKTGLARDDRLALAHLYPVELEDLSCMGFIGSIESPSPPSPPNWAILSLSIGFLSIFLVVKVFQTLFSPLSKRVWIEYKSFHEREKKY